MYGFAYWYSYDASVWVTPNCSPLLHPKEVKGKQQGVLWLLKNYGACLLEYEIHGI